MSKRITYSVVKQCTAPTGSLLAKHGAKGEYVDCFQVTLSTKSESTSVRSFLDSFYSCKAFYPESILLWSISQLYQLPPLKSGGGQSYGYGFFRVLEETDKEVILDSGGVQTWMCVEKSEATTEFKFGSILKKTNFLSRMLIAPHQWYSKLLLASAVTKHKAKDAE